MATRMDLPIRREPWIDACPHAKKWNAEAAQKALNETHRVGALQPFGNRQGYETAPYLVATALSISVIYGMDYSINLGKWFTPR